MTVCSTAPVFLEMFFCCWIVLAISVSLWSVGAELPDCARLTSCDDCIRSNETCVWCSDPNAPISSRCVPQAMMSNSSNCSSFEEPRGSVEAEHNAEFSDTVQLLPEFASVSLTSGEVMEFNISIKPAANFPLDVYFLMDFSNSMIDDLETLKGIVDDLAVLLGSISPDFTIGFGSFVDKPTLPFYTDVCLKETPDCLPTYSYSHTLSLTSNTSTFRDAIGSISELSISLDAPEGGLDAILQAVVCTNEIGWRPSPARHILIYMSDDHFHFGADGKLGGALHPHDGRCHLNSANQYTKSLLLDYPSLSIVLDKLDEHLVSVLIASAARSSSPVNNALRLVAESFPYFSFEEVASNSANLLPAIRSAYDTSIGSTVQLRATVVDGLEVTFSSGCITNLKEKPGQCSELSVGNVSTATVRLKLTDCELFGQNTSVIISAGTYGQMTVIVNPICQCACTGNRTSNQSLCSGSGEVVCGLCECDANSYGPNCECSRMANSSLGIGECRVGPNRMVCSGHGECTCSECSCETNVGGDSSQMYYGATCECDNFSCLRDTSARLCSGNGRCDCGSCGCNEHYTGELCDCYLLNNTCVDPGTNLLCNDLGECSSCGRCECIQGYIGEHCSICGSPEICGVRQCSTFQECISCLYTVNSAVEVVYVGLPLANNSCPALCVDLEHHLSQPNTAMPSSAPCRAPVSTTVCGSGQIMYGVVQDQRDGSVTIVVERTPQGCQTGEVQPWVIGVSAAGGVLAVALAIIVIVVVKIVMVVRDRIEFKKFQLEAEMATNRLDTAVTNPLFSSAVQEIACPLYQGNVNWNENNDL